MAFGPTLTPISTASTSAGEPVTIGMSASVAGRLFTRFATAAARKAASSSAPTVVVSGMRCRSTEPRPCSVTPSTITARASTNRQNPGLASPTSRRTDSPSRRNRGMISSRQPPMAAQAGLTSTELVTTNPTTVTASTPSA